MADVMHFDYCPTCGGDLDTGWECNKCDRDWQLYATAPTTMQDLKAAKRSAETILGNMAATNPEYTPWKPWRSRWQINDEPLRHDAENWMRRFGYPQAF